MTTTAGASIAVANVADNIAIYAPLFATFGTGGVAGTLLVFHALVALVALWRLAGLLIGSRPAVIRIVEWAGHYAIPVVLIALGIFILAESGLPQTLLG